MVWLPTSSTLLITLLSISLITISLLTISLLTGPPLLVLAGLIFLGAVLLSRRLSLFPLGCTPLAGHAYTKRTEVPISLYFMRPSLLCVSFLHCLGAIPLCEQCFLSTQCYAQSSTSPDTQQDLVTSEVANPPKEAYQQSEWRDIATGLQIKVVELSTGFLSGEITLLKTSLSHFRPQVVRAASFQRNGADVEWYSKRTGASACLNAHFFDQTGSPLGLVVSRGIEHKRMQLGGTLLTGFFLAYHKRLEIRERDKNHKGGLEAIQSGPRLVINGAVANDLDDINESRRSGICTTSPTEYILFVASSPFRGATLKELGDILSSPQIQCENALNFDGGGSTQLFVRQDLPGAQVGFRGIHVLGRDEVPTVLCLFPAS